MLEILKNQVEPSIKDKATEIYQATKQWGYQGSKPLVRGLKLWEYDIKTKVLSEAKFLQSVVDVTGSAHHSVAFNANAIYHQAHNYRAAARKFNKLFALIGLPDRVPDKK